MVKRERAGESAADERREQVAQATWRVIAREGLDRASLRAIAHELGSTTGVLTHYFRDKDALLDFAFASIVEKLQLGAQATDTPPSNFEGLKSLLSAYLPVCADTRTWWRVWLAFTVAALSNERQGASHAKLYKELRRFWKQILTGFSEQGLLRSGLDPALEAETLLALIDGIGVHALISPRSMTAARQFEIVENHLAKLAAAGD